VIKIYFVGAHSTGKTTLARYVSKHYKLPLLTEVARSVLAERELSIDGLRTDLSLVDDYQLTIFERQIAEEKRLRKFVSDRSFDNLAYAAQHSRILFGLMKERRLQEYVRSLRDPNVIIFFVRPAKVTIHSDGVRESGAWRDIVAIDAMVKLLLEMWGLRYLPVASVSMQERVRSVDMILSLAGVAKAPL